MPPDPERGIGDHRRFRRQWRGRAEPLHAAYFSVTPLAFAARRSASAISEGVAATSMPHSLNTAIFAAAVSSAPPTIAPAWPMRRPAGGVAPAMKPATGFLQLALTQRAASTSAL